MLVTLRPTTREEWTQVYDESFPFSGAPSVYFSAFVEGTFLGIVGADNVIDGYGEFRLSLVAPFHGNAYVRPVLNAFIVEAFTTLGLSVLYGSYRQGDRETDALWRSMLTIPNPILVDHAPELVGSTVFTLDAVNPRDDEATRAQALTRWRIVKQLDEATRAMLRGQTVRMAVEGEV